MHSGNRHGPLPCIFLYSYLLLCTHSLSLPHSCTFSLSPSLTHILFLKLTHTPILSLYLTQEYTFSLSLYAHLHLHIQMVLQDLWHGSSDLADTSEKRTFSFQQKHETNRLSILSKNYMTQWKIIGALQPLSYSILLPVLKVIRPPKLILSQWFRFWWRNQILIRAQFQLNNDFNLNWAI